MQGECCPVTSAVGLIEAMVCSLSQSCLGCRTWGQSACGGDSMAGDSESERECTQEMVCWRR